MTSEIACAKQFVSTSMNGWLHEHESSEQRSSSSGVGSSRRHDLLDTYGRSLGGVDSRSTTVPSVATPYLKLQDLDLMSWASSNPGQQQFYQMTGMPMNMGSLLSQEMAQSSHLPSGSALAPPPPQVMQQQQQQQPDYSRPSSSSSSLRSISVGSPECSSLLRNIASTGGAALPEPSDPAQGLAQPLVPTPTATGATYSRLRDASTSQLPSPRNDDLALMKAMLAVLSNPPSQTQPHPFAAESSMHPSTPSPQAPAAAVGRAGAFKPYRLGPFSRRFKPAGSSSGHSMIRRLHGMLRVVDGLRAEEKAEAAAAAAAAHVSAKGPTTNQLHHMISERRRREKLNDSFQALRALLPPGTKRDKASVLATTKDYLANLKAQVLDLEEKNLMLESKMPLKEKVEELSTSMTERPLIQITQTPQTTTAMPQINLSLAMRVECDILDVVLSILECIKERGFLNLVSMDVDHTVSTQIVKAKFILQVSRGAEWDEGAFKEAVAAAVDGVAARRK